MNDRRCRVGRWMSLFIGLGLLSGCQTLPPPTSAAGGNALPAACRWPAGSADPLERLRATREALEGQGYAILDTDATLGLVSAERKTLQPGLGAVESPFGRTGFWGGFGLGGRNGYSLGVFQNFGGGYNTDPVQIERVSVELARDGEGCVGDCTGTAWAGVACGVTGGGDSGGSRRKCVSAEV